MDIGEVITYKGRRYRILGVDPQGVVPQNVYLEHVETGDQLRVGVLDLRRQLHLVRRDLPDERRRLDR